MHPLNGSLPGPYVPVRVTRSALVHIGTLMHRLAAEPRSTAGVLFALSVSIWNDRANQVFDGGGLAGFKNSANAFLLAYAALSFYSFYFYLLSVYRLVLWGWGLRTDRVYITLSQPCTADLFLNNNNNNNNNKAVVSVIG